MKRNTLLISLSLTLAACSSTPPSQLQANRIMALSVPTEAPFIRLELSGPQDLVQEATANSQGQATFNFPNLMAGTYTITARAFNSRPQQGDPATGVVLYKTVIKNHVFDGTPLNIGLKRLTSTLSLDVSGIDPVARFLSAKIGNKQVALNVTGTTATGKLLGVETGVGRDVIVEGRNTPGGAVVQQGTAQVTLNETASSTSIQMQPVAGTPPEIPVLTGASSVKKGEVYSLKIDSSDQHADLKNLRIDWGDGEIEDVTLSGRTDSRTLSHTFSAPGSRNVSVVVTNVNNLARSATRSVNVVDTSTGTVVVGLSEELTEVTLRVNGAPESATGLQATIVDPNFAGLQKSAISRQEFQSQYQIDLLPLADGTWTATLGLPRDVSYTYSLNAGRIEGGSGSFSSEGDAQTVNWTFQQGANVAPEVKTFKLSASAGNAPLNVTFTVQGDDVEGDALTCQLDTDGNGTTDFTIEHCETQKTQSFTYTANGRFTPILKVVDSKGAVGKGARVVKTGRTPWVAGYYTGWNAGHSSTDENPRPQDLDFGGLTHLMVASIWANFEEGTTQYTGINTSFFQGPGGADWARAGASEAHKNGDKALLMLGGSGFRDGLVIAMQPQYRKQFVQDLLQTMNSLGFDGIDLDWEPIHVGLDPVLGIEVDDRVFITQLAEDLRAAKPDIILTLPVGWLNVNTDQADPWVAEIAPLLDQINIMSYDMAGPWGWSTWHSSALFGEGGDHPTSVSSTTQRYLAAGVPASKFGVGIGFYGNCFRRSFAPLDPIRGIMGTGDNEMTYRRIKTLYGNHDVNVRMWDDIAKVPYLSSKPLGAGVHLNAGHPNQGVQDCDFVSYEDPQSILAKGQYARDLGLGGAIIWTVNQGYFRNPADGDHNPLLTATREGFLQ